MKRFISFILATVLFTVLGFHNSVMAFGSSSDMSMGNHSQMESQHEKCHEISIDDCESICCIDNDSKAQVSIINIQNNKKKLEKMKSNISELCFNDSLINEWNLFGNISPPPDGNIFEEYNYVSLVGIIKSNI